MQGAEGAEGAEGVYVVSHSWAKDYRLTKLWHMGFIVIQNDKYGSWSYLKSLDYKGSLK